MGTAEHTDPAPPAGPETTATTGQIGIQSPVRKADETSAAARSPERQPTGTNAAS